MRSGLLATWLADRGHTVTWWATSFDHARKEYRCNAASSYDWRPGITIRYLHSPTPYQKNISWSRFVNHREIAEDFRRTIEALDPPDVILSGMPTPELCLEAVRFGKKKKIPALLDIRDLWPDDMIGLAPWPIRWAAQLALTPISNTVKAACREAAGICATSPIFVDWGVKKSGRTRQSLDADFPLGYSDQAPADSDCRRAEDFWSEKGINGDAGEFTVCFFGALGATCLLKPAIDAARRFALEGRQIRLVVCGKGDRFGEFRDYARDVDNVLFTGWVGRPEIWTLMRMADVGLVPVKNIFSYMSNCPNKTIEYMSAGLPLLSSLGGILGQLIEGERIGLIYSEENVEDLCAQLRRLMDDPAGRHEMARNARQLFKERFSAEKVYTAFSEHLENVVKG